MKAYCSIAASALAKFVKVNEELSDADAVLGHEGLETLFNVELEGERLSAQVSLERTRMAMRCVAHILYLIGVIN